MDVGDKNCQICCQDRVTYSKHIFISWCTNANRQVSCELSWRTSPVKFFIRRMLYNLSRLDLDIGLSWHWIQSKLDRDWFYLSRKCSFFIVRNSILSWPDMDSRLKNYRYINHGILYTVYNIPFISVMAVRFSLKTTL